MANSVFGNPTLGGTNTWTGSNTFPYITVTGGIFSTDLTNPSVGTGVQVAYYPGNSTGYVRAYKFDGTPAYKALLIDGLTTGLNVASGGATTVGGVLKVTTSTYADNAAAISGGLSAGSIYKTATGVAMVVY